MLCLRRKEDEIRLKRGSANMMANIVSLLMHMKHLVTCIRTDGIFKELEEFRASTPLTPFEARKIKYIPQHEKLCLSVSEVHRVYEAVHQDKPVVPVVTVVLGSDKSIQNVTETALLNPYSAALHTNFDSEFQEEPLTALNNADLPWSIPNTQMQYKTAIQNCYFKSLYDSPLFCTFEKQNFDENECVEDMSAEHFEEVSCELQNSSNFEEHVDVTTTYLGRYMAQGGPRILNS